MDRRGTLAAVPGTVAWSAARPADCSTDRICRARVDDRGGTERNHPRPARGPWAGHCRRIGGGARVGAKGHRSGTRVARGRGLRAAGALYGGRNRGGVVRAPAARAHPPLHGGSPARRDPTGRGARLPAFPVQLAARFTRMRAWRGRTPSRSWSGSSKASRRRPAPGRPRSCRRGSPITSRPGSTTNAFRGGSSGRVYVPATRGQMAASAIRRRCGQRRSRSWRGATPHSGQRCPLPPTRFHAARRRKR